MPDYPESVEERARLYLHCMVEIKERLRLVFQVIRLDTGDLFKNEICSLQFRHICELIAVACLAAQGDFQTQRAFREEYSPAKIFNALRKRFPNFFPMPSRVTITPREGGGNSHHIEPNQSPDSLTEKDVTEIWGRSGDDLHRLSVNKYLERSFSVAPPLEPVVDRANALAALLNTHLIPIGDPEDLVYLDVRMHDHEGSCAAHFISLNRETGEAEVIGFQAKLVGQ